MIDTTTSTLLSDGYQLVQETKSGVNTQIDFLFSYYYNCNFLHFIVK